MGSGNRWRWSSVGMLRCMLSAQCALGIMVVMADLPPDLLAGFGGIGPQVPASDVPVAPGDQTRRFEPRRLPSDRPAGPGFPGDETIPPRLTFTAIEMAGSGKALLLTGTISEGDSRRFTEHLAALPAPPNAIALHSPGGLVSEALQIGREIRHAGLRVVVAPGASCFSACPYILAGGEERSVSREGRVGVHQHYFGENSYLPAFLAVSDVQEGQGEVMAYLDEMGIDPMVMAKALMTPPEDIYILLPHELEKFHMATRLTE
jgi:hypothetical protein